MRLEDLGDDISPRARLPLLQGFDFLGGEFLAGRVIDGLAVRAHDDFTVRADFELHAIRAVDDEGLAAFAFGRGGDAVADGLGVQLGGGDDAEAGGAAIRAAVGYLEGEVVGAAEDVVSLESAEFANGNDSVA